MTAIPGSGEMAKLSNKQIEAKLKTLNGWSIQDNSIKKNYVLKDFTNALAFVNHVGWLAEKADHHPDINIHRYKNVTLTFSTHSEGGLTEKDFGMAKRIDS